MTTRFRTLLQFGLTAVTLFASGCFVETSSSGSRADCLAQQYFNLVWSMDWGPTTTPLTCEEAAQAGADVVQLETNRGILDVGKECGHFSYMGRIYQFSGSTEDATFDRRLTPGTYVISARLLATDGSVLSSAAGPGAGYPIGACSPVDLAYIFTLPIQ